MCSLGRLVGGLLLRGVLRGLLDGKRLGIWGGSYGGYLTALALARNSDIFKAGVDLHGVHDWSRLMDELTGKQATRYEKGDREKAMAAGCDDFDTKPVDLPRLLEKIEALLGRPPSA